MLYIAYLYLILYLLIPFPSLASLLTPSPRVTTRLFSVSMSLLLFCYTHLFYFLDATYKWEYTVFVFLCLSYFTKPNTLQVHRSCCKWQDFTLFYGWVLVHCVCSHTHYIFFIKVASIVRWLCIMLLMNLGVHISFQICIFIFLQIYTLEWNCWIIW